MRILLRIFLLGSIFLLPPLSVFAWGGVEHKVIARIAWDNLTPETRKAVLELMLKAPPDSQIQELLAISEGDPRLFFINASVWADLVKNPASHDRQMKYSCPLWHFAEFTFGEPGVEVPDLPAFKPRQVNVMERLQFFQKTLLDESEPISNRAVELIWTIHLVGDIHQPLHVASRVTKAEPESDLGGNKFRLGRRNLHAYWDLILSSHFAPTDNEQNDHYIKRLADIVTKECPQAKLAETLTRTKPEDWAAESFDLAKSVVYSDVIRGKDPAKEYEDRAMAEGEKRIALAGYRLAQMLNQFFGATRKQIASAPTISENSKKIKARLDYDLACVASTLDSKTRELSIVNGTALDGQAAGQKVQGFDSNQVKRIINETKEALLETLAGEELAGLRAYAAKYFPDPNTLETIRVGAPPHAALEPGRGPNSSSSLRRHSSNHSAVQAFGISLVPAVNSLISKASNVILGTRRGSGPIRLEVQTKPAQGANIVLQAPGGKRYATSTNSFIADFFPGTYSFTVTRDGFVTVQHFNVDLGFGNSAIECTLVNSGTPRLCTFK
ncbi:MAG TPA: S1/P1 nuclease [Pyrinomonadaceae bacterium]|nr:S1/P1 nuclease [Pyrinomonadaceae bacterium]